MNNWLFLGLNLGLNMLLGIEKHVLELSVLSFSLFIERFQNVIYVSNSFI